MQFNVDCAIDIMNFIIDNQKLENGKLDILYCKYLYQDDKLKQYDKDIIFYAILKLYEGGYIDASIQINQNNYHIRYIKGLTIRGHEFCEHMKEPTISQKVKHNLKSIGKHSLAYAESIIHDCLIEASKQAVKISMNPNNNP